MKTTQVVDALLRDKIAGLGFELDEVEFAKEHGNWVLTLYIDSANGVSVEDCERVSRFVEPILDEADPIEPSYFLSVSSIGIDRPLKKNRDFERALGCKIVVKLYSPVNGEKDFLGELIEFDDETFTITPQPQKNRRKSKKASEPLDKLTLKRHDAALIRPYIDFAALEKEYAELEDGFDGVEAEQTDEELNYSLADRRLNDEQ